MSINQINTIESIVTGITRQILDTDNADSNFDYLTDKSEDAHSALKWILENSSTHEPDDGQNKILDISISILLDTYKDKSILPSVIDMIFKRKKNKQNTHYLVWAVFRTGNPEALKLIAAHILSPDYEEAEFARRLLNVEKWDNDNQKQYESYIAWLEENIPFLYFTGESNQFTSKPVMYIVDLEKKYLQRSGKTSETPPDVAGDGNDPIKIHDFSVLINEEKSLLSGYSHMLYKKDISGWEEWMSLPVADQIKLAKSGLEG